MSGLKPCYFRRLRQLSGFSLLVERVCSETTLPSRFLRQIPRPLPTRHDGRRPLRPLRRLRLRTRRPWRVRLSPWQSSSRRHSHVRNHRRPQPQRPHLPTRLRHRPLRPTGHLRCRRVIPRTLLPRQGPQPLLHCLHEGRPHGGSDRIFGARLSCETKHTMQNLGVCRYGNNQQTCQNSKIHQSSRTAKSAFFPAGPRWDFSVTRGVSRAQNKLWGPLLWQPMYPTLSYNMSKCSD